MSRQMQQTHGAGTAPLPRRTPSAMLLVLPLMLAACGEKATRSVEAGMGVAPELVPPKRTLIPTLNIAPATGWPGGSTPRPAQGLSVNAFAGNLDHPRWLYVLPNGDVLVAESNAPERPDDGDGLKGWVQNRAMRRAGAGVPSADRITLLRDADDDGVAEVRSVFRAGLHSPFGMVLVGENLIVANTDALVRFDYRTGDTMLHGEGTVIAALPAGPINHHWTKNVIASEDGRTLYATVGSNSNVAENGIENETLRAAILAVDIAAGAVRVFASGLRNPNGLAWEPHTGMLWTTVNERDELGSDLVPDYMTSVREGDFFGWPYSYFGPHVDARVTPPRPDLVARARVRACRTTRWARTPPHSASRSTSPRNCPNTTAVALSSGSTDRGIAIRRVAIRWCSCHSARANRRASRTSC